ncbi:MAG: hypothetical protein ACRYGB_15090 [Janthinobacterium lividum]
MTINIFKISDCAGSAHVAGDDEISETYFATVTDSFGDERPTFKVYSIGPFYGSKIIFKKDLSDTYSITLQHHNSGHPEIHQLKINLKNIIYK